jgi:hypothetical protein
MNGMIPGCSSWGTSPASTNGLLNNLVAYYSLDNVSDATGRGNTLTNNGGASFVAGRVGNCANFVAASGQRLVRASTSDLVLGDIDFTITCWVNLGDKSVDRPIVVKGDGGGYEYGIVYDAAQDMFKFTDSNHSVLASTFGSPSLATWYFIAVTYLNGSSFPSISVNSGAADADGIGQIPDTKNFNIGTDGGGVSFMDGRMDEVGIWKAVLTPDQLTALYNSGAGLAYSQFQN